MTQKFYPHGPLMGEWPFINGRLEGVVKTYYANGVLKEKRHYVQDKLEGEAAFFNVAGTLIEEITYRDNEMHGTRKVYGKDGRLLLEQEYQDGRLLDENGAFAQGWKVVMRDGQTFRKTKFEDGRPTGQDRLYSTDGNLIEESEYQKGKLISLIRYDKDGTEIRRYDQDELEAIRLNNRAHAIYVNSGEYEEGLGLISNALSIDESNPVFHATKAELLFAMQAYDRALHSVMRARALAPDDEAIQVIEQMIQLAMQSLEKDL